MRMKKGTADCFETLPGVSAVVVKPASFADAYRLRQQQSQRTLSGPDRTSVNLMGVFSGEVLVSLHSLLGGASEAVTITARLTLLTALAATLIMGVLLGELRRPALEQLRVLGAPQRYIMSLVWCIVMTVVAAGTAGGLVLGFIGAEAAAHRCHFARHGLARTSRRRGHAPCGFVLRPHSRMARGEAPHPLSASLRALSERPSPSKRRALVASGVRRQSVIENSRKRLQDVNARSRRRHAALKESVLQAQGNPGKAQTRSPEVPDRDRR